MRVLDRLSVCIASVVCFVMLVPSFTIQAAEVTRIGQAPAPRTEPKLGRTAAAEIVSLALPLAVDKTAIDAFITRLYDPQSPDFHHYLTPQQYSDRFVDHAARVEVEDYLRGQGLKVTSGETGSLVTAEGTATQTEQAFGVTLSDYRAADGRQFYAAAPAPALPARVANRVSGVLGLENAERERSHAIEAPISDPSPTAKVAPRSASGCAGATTTASLTGAFTPNQFATAYNFDLLYAANVRGEGQTVALFELDDYSDVNVATFQTCFGTNVPVSRVTNLAAPTLSGGQVEVELDIDIVVSMAPQLGRLLVYETQNTTSNATALYQRIANDNAAQTVSTSWGNCEANRSSSTLMARNTIFQQMATQGQSMFAAAGDDGSQDCGGTNTQIAVDHPASDPYVTGVGGTRLSLSSNNALTDETTWNEYSGGYGATGGGMSSYFTRFPYQDVVSTNIPREVPDVSADADPRTGYVVYTHSPTSCPRTTGISGSTDCYLAFGGTSASAPLWAAATVLINQYIVTRGGSALGFANMTLYRLYTRVPSAFRDITSGNNCYLGPTCGTPGFGQYPATTGYDLTTGLGSLNVYAIAANLLPPPTITGVSPTQGTATGGYAVQIYGSNFLAGASVHFGSASASGISLVNASTLSVIVPAYCCGTVTVSVTNPGGQRATLANAFTFVPAPVITGLNPSNGVNVGNTLINIQGQSFQPGATVLIGGRAATSVTYVNSSTLSVRTPLGVIGVASVTVTNPDGQATTLANAFIYTGPTLSSLSSSSAYTSGGTIISITGTGFQYGASVYLSDIYATNVSVSSASLLTFTAPMHPQGLVNVTVTNPDGSATTLVNALQYSRYNPAPISGTVPAMVAAPHPAAPAVTAMPAPQPSRH